MAAHGRHLEISILLEHISTGIEMVYPFPGKPAVDLLIEGAVPRLTLRATIEEPTAAPVNLLRHVRVQTTSADGRWCVTVAIQGAELMLDGHAMLCTIADRIQLDGLDPTLAVSETLQQWRAVLAARSRLTTEDEIGLVGELLVLEALCTATTPKALEAWRGAANEEHDFGLSDLDLEVKTTSTEHRQHWISGLKQLLPTGSRPLALVSLQITRGGQAGRTLPTLIETLRATVDADPLNDKLGSVGWDDAAGDLFVDRWLLRSDPTFFIIDETFPAVTPQLLGLAAADMTPVVDVRYRIDLDHRPGDAVADAGLAAAITMLSKEGAKP